MARIDTLEFWFVTANVSSCGDVEYMINGHSLEDKHFSAPIDVLDCMSDTVTANGVFYYLGLPWRPRRD